MKVSREKLVRLLYYSNLILGVSATIDMILYFNINFHVPSIVVTFFSIAFILNNIALAKVMENE